VQKVVLVVLAALVVAAAGFFGWRFAVKAQRDARYDTWRGQLGDESRREAVISALRDELKENPDVSETHGLLGEALFAAGRDSDAAVALRKAIVLDKGNLKARRALARACLRLSRIDEAIQTLEDAVPGIDGADRARVELELGRAYQERYRGSSKEEDFRAAHNRFQEARNDPATEAEALDGYAALWLEKGRNQDLGKAISTWRELLSKYPDYPRATAIRELVDHFDSAAKGAANAGGADQH
jgi:cytochrome c-type biogenesis protein CcmH/NrfG